VPFPPSDDLALEPRIKVGGGFWQSKQAGRWLQQPLETGLAGAQTAAIETSDRFRTEGKPVREVNETAGLPSTRIVAAGI
jgi:hypothetical protein